MLNKKKIRKCFIILFWLLVWSGLAMAVNNQILLASPIDTFRGLLEILGEEECYLTVGRSVLRIGCGFLAGVGAALSLAVGSYKFSWLEELIVPVMNLMKTVPAASFVVLFLIWWGSSFLSVAICFLVVAPNIYINVLEGLKSLDGQLLEMAGVFRLSFWNRFFYIFRPALKPFLVSSLKISLGMCWKSGVAAEVIGTPDFSIGERMYLSKVYLDTAGLFAWTVVTVLLSVLFEKIILRAAGVFFAWEPYCKEQLPFGIAQGKRGADTGSEGERKGDIKCRNIVKKYGDTLVLNRVNEVYEQGKTYYLTAPSGSGKTTLLRILAGLETPDGGSVEASFACGMVFQEDRLCEDYSAVKNVELVTGNRLQAEEALLALLEQDALGKPCSQLSGGMKRRVALARALESKSSYLLLDEPFTGMDAGTRKRAEEYIRNRQRGRTLIIATHIGETVGEA